MKAEYRKDLQKNYLILSIENQGMEESYDLRMITENQIEGLLSCERRLLNNDVLYYYDITSQCSLEDKCKAERIQGQEILWLLNKILSVLDKLEEYLLSEKALCIVPQYIYMDETEEQINFCYVPGEKWDFQVQLRDLMEYLLPYLDHSHQESVTIGYGLYHYILREKFTVEGVHEQLSLYRRINKEKKLLEKQDNEAIVEEQIIEEEKNEFLPELWNLDVDSIHEDKEKHSYWVSSLFATIGLIWVLGGWFLWRNFKLFLWIWGIIGGGLVLLLTFVNVKFIRKKSESITTKENRMKENQMEEWDTYTQVLNAVPKERTYVLKNENHVITLMNNESYIIGRDKKVSDIVLSSNMISRRHAQIRLTKSACFLKDLYSKNGVFVKGIELAKGEEIELFGGEFIQFADVSYYFQREN